MHLVHLLVLVLALPCTLAEQEAAPGPPQASEESGNNYD